MNYPEHEKLNTIEINRIDELIEWLHSKGYSIVKLENLEFYRGSIEHADWDRLRLEYFGADPDKIEEERKEMIKSLNNNGNQ
jgi:hypothetical protein